MPRAVVPAQDVEPWAAALRAPTGDGALYETESERSRTAAVRFVSRLEAGSLERLLHSLLSATPRPPVKHLTREQKALLVERLRRRGNQ